VPPAETQELGVKSEESKAIAKSKALPTQVAYSCRELLKLEVYYIKAVHFAHLSSIEKIL
jgi:hypothetical protein